MRARARDSAARFISAKRRDAANMAKLHEKCAFWRRAGRGRAGGSVKIIDMILD